MYEKQEKPDTNSESQVWKFSLIAASLLILLPPIDDVS